MQKELKATFGNFPEADEKSIDFLTKALERNNLKGFDYLEFKRALAALAKMDMNEELAYKSTFATAQTVGLSKETLLKTASHYKNVLKGEEKQFDQAMQNQFNKRVTSKQVEVKKLEKNVEVWKAKIKELEGKISEAEKVIGGIDKVVKEETRKIEDAKTKFDKTLKMIISQIEEDEKKIKTFL